MTVRLVLALLTAFALLLASCGGDDTTDAGDTGDQTTDDGGTQAGDDTGGGDDTTDEPADGGDMAAGDEGGEVTIGGTTYVVVPSIQCLVLPTTVSIAGHAASDETIEIVFDVFEPGDENLSVSQGSQFGWSAGADAIEATIDGKTVTGSATVQSQSGESADATFEFVCA